MYKFSEKIKSWMPSAAAWKGATLGIILAGLLLGLSSAVDLWQNNVSLGAASVYFVLGSLLASIIGAVLVFVWISLMAMPPAYKWALASLIFLIYYFFIPEQAPLGVFLLTLWAILAFSITFGAASVILAKILNRQDTLKSYFLPLLCLGLGIAGLSLLSLWLFAEEGSFTPPQPQPSRLNSKTISLADPAQAGAYTYTSFTYGAGNDRHRPEYNKNITLQTEPVDGSPFINGWNGPDGWLRTRYWGFDERQLPLNARVWLPLGIGPFPLVMLVHGNHEMSVSSDAGYDYLARLFASRGFAVIAIDENFLNGSWTDISEGLNELAARGWLILEHLALLRNWNNTPEHALYGKLDMENIALVGHSRGGEAIVTAAAFNQLNHFPSNGNIPFDYHFNIKALAAIAPVDAQYMPGGVKLSLANVDYLVIQGSHDGDVRTFEGSGQYQRITFTDADYHFKTALYVFGANHGQFNTLWGKKDAPSPVSALFDLGKILPVNQQQQIAKVYLSAFLEATLHKQKEYLALFKNYRSGLQWLPQTLYINAFADSTYQYVENKKTDVNLSRGVRGVHLMGKHLDVWRLGSATLANGTVIQTGVLLGWSNQHRVIPEYILTLPKNAFEITSKNTLVMTLANAATAENVDEEDQPSIKNALGSLSNSSVDFTIEIIDDAGNIASMKLSDVAFLSPMLKINPYKNALFNPLSSKEYVFQTFEFPLEDFLKSNPQFQLANLHKIVLKFNKSPKGMILLESVAFLKESY